MNQNKTENNNEDIINEQTQEYIDNTNTAEEEKEVEHNLKLTQLVQKGKVSLLDKASNVLKP